MTREVEARQRAVMTAVYDTDLPPLEAAAASWERTVEAARRYGPLFFELAAHAMQDRDHAARLRERLVAAWLPSVTELCLAIGVPAAQAQSHARWPSARLGACSSTCWSAATGRKPAGRRIS